MRLQVDTFEPLPPWVNRSYEDFGFYKLGLMCWTYNGYDGQIEWINTLRFCSEPKYDDCTGFRIWMQKDVLFRVVDHKVEAKLLPPIISENQPVNPLTGEGLPQHLHSL